MKSTINSLPPTPSKNVSARFGFGVLVGWLCVLAPSLVFGLLAEDVATRESFRFDTPLLLWLHAHSNPFFDTAMLAFTWAGGVVVLAFSGVVMGVLLWRKLRVQALFLLSAMVGTSLLNVAMKFAFQRTRPSLWQSLAPEYDTGFPSGHSMLSCAFVLAMLMLVWKSDGSATLKWTLTTLGFLFVAGVGLSRLYLGVHYPSDVLAGWSLSLAWVSLLGSLFARRLRPVV